MNEPVAAPASPAAYATPATGRTAGVWTWAALLTALVALAGTLYLSMGMGARACPLCYYQRTAVMGVVGILLVGVFVRGLPPGLVSLLALPLAVTGLAVAAYHNYLEINGNLECPLGVFELGTAPQQSLAVLSLLVLFLVVDVLANGRGSVRWTAVPAALLGLGFAFAGVAAVRSEVPPKADYSLPLEKAGCRKPQPPQ